MFTVALAVLAQSLSVVPADWKTYNNPVGQFTTCYPATLKPKHNLKSATGTGYTFTDGSTIVAAHTTANIFETSAKDWSDSTVAENEKVVTRVDKPDYTVLVGMRGNDVFWQKVVQRKDDFVIISITFPVNKKQWGTELVRTIAACTRS